MPTTRVAVVAESPVVRAGLRALLEAEPGVVVVAALAAPDALAAIDADVLVVAAATPDLAPLSRRDDDAFGEAVRRPAIVLLADRIDVDTARRALAGGARAVLPLDAGEAVVMAALHAAAAGLVTLPRELAPLLLEGDAMETAGAVPTTGTTPDATRAAPTAALTPREREVLALLAQGLANKAIAPRLGITEHTVKAHVAAIYEKLGAGNRAEAAIAAARLGLLML